MAIVPEGYVTTYGDIAAMAGSPRASRIVGGVAHYGDAQLPWHRLVNAKGGLARGFPGGMHAQAELLSQEGVECRSFVVQGFNERRWKW